MPTRSASPPLRARSSRSAVAPGTTSALVLQGGGALGSYQAGVFEAIDQQRRPLDWVAGVSIGAINAALIAGNAPEQRVPRLREFWMQLSSAPAQRLPEWCGPRLWRSQWSAAAAMGMGIPGLFQPRFDPSLLLGDNAPLTSYYDTAPLRSTLERLVDFDRINHGAMRFSIGAVSVRGGNSVYFDNRRDTIGPEHVMASGALPPGFPPVRIAGEDYWDGGLVSNTPLQYVLDEHERARPLLAMQVDLFSARGALPATLSGVGARVKDIEYSSRTRMNTDVLVDNVNLQQTLADALGQLPPALRDRPGVAELLARLTRAPVEIVHLIYRNRPDELDNKDYEFSRASVQYHWAAGLRDMRATLAHPDWLQRKVLTGGVVTYDLSEPDGARVHLAATHPRAPGGKTFVLSK